MSALAGRVFFLCFGVALGVVALHIHFEAPSISGWLSLSLGVLALAALFAGIVGGRKLFEAVNAALEGCGALLTLLSALFRK